MNKNYLIIVLFLPFFGMAQSVIGNINSGAVSENSFNHSIGEIYVIPNNLDDANSGTMGILYQTTLKVLGVTEAEKESVKIYPNPTADYVFLKLSSKVKLATAEIYDLSGKLISQTKINEDRLDLRFLNHGTYLLKFKNSNIPSIKIIKK
ncbi:T9SS type A sorting domain-containing protein [Chryseobacterium sp. KACC 21268]|nr:T9SS type A sorting domain-containing protein [Chryseobacterium sp. KACC 21268]